MNDILLTAPLWSLFLFSLIPLSLKLLNQNREYPFFVSIGVVLTGIGVSILCLLLICWPVFEDTEVYTLFSSALVLNEFRAIGTVILLISSAIAFLMSFQHPQVNLDRFSEILFLKMGALIGLMVLLWSGNLLTAFIGLELASLSFYLLIALGRTGPSALKASFKYFILGSVAGAFLLYGIAFTAGAVGHFDLMKVRQFAPELISQSRFLALALILIMAGFLFKVSVFPFHSWLPDVYHGSATPLLVFMATGFKLVVFILLFEWTKGIWTNPDLQFLLSLFQWLAVLSVLFGNIIVLMEKDFKKILLFSTIAHSGYLLMILIASQAGFEEGRTALLYYLILYSFMTLGVFICLRPFEKVHKSAVPLRALKGLARQRPFHAFFITVFLLSLAGVPPTGGFIAKVFLFRSLLDTGFWWMLFWTIVGSSVALFYYLKPIALMYMPVEQGGREPTAEPTAERSDPLSYKPFPLFLKPVLWLLVGLIFISFLWPSWFTFS